MDPEHPKFIDFSKSNYSNDVYIDDKFLNEKERLEKEEEIKKAEELRKMLADKAAKDENIDNFIKKFLATSDEFYTIEIGSFNNQKDATNYIKEKQFDKNSFAYDTVEDTNINSKIAYGIFPNMEMAKIESENLSKISNKKTLVIKKVNEVKKLYNDYVIGLKVKLPDPEVQVVEKINTIEKIKQEKKEPEFQYNEAFKNSFLTANKEFYTINITSFNNKNELEKILKANPTLLENSIAYNYSNGTPLIRWDYGVYETYDEAQKAIESLGEIGDSYYPVVQKISKEQELYNTNIIPEIKKETKETEFEYINVSSKVEYKDPITLKEDKKIENKVQKPDSKPIKEKDEVEVKEVVKKLEQMPIIKKQEEIKQVSKKPDPKPIKEKDEVEVKEVVEKLEQMPIIKKQEENKAVSKKPDPKPIKEKDEEIAPVTRTIDAKPKKEPDVVDERVPTSGVR
jgi:septal ring-binding cell division protein DamX